MSSDRVVPDGAHHSGLMKDYGGQYNPEYLAPGVWHDISCAPRNGFDEILVFCPYEGVGVVKWVAHKNHNRGGWQACSFGVCDFENGAEVSPTLWMHLPKPRGLLAAIRND